jgi:menaquinone-dependent protoporphyrinogen oxidase
MNKKILVAFATRYGSTKEIAEFIAAILREEGIDADSKNMLDIKDIDSYDFVIAGSSIQMGKWLPEAREFMQIHKNYLKKMPLFVFSCGITLNKQDENVTRKALFATDEIQQYVNPKEIGLFAGKLEEKILCDSDRELIILAKPDYGDFRNFDTIRSWIKTIRTDYLPD